MEQKHAEYYDAAELDRLRERATARALNESIFPESPDAREPLVEPAVFTVSRDGGQWQGVGAFRRDGTQSAILRWSWHEGVSQGAGYRHSTIEYFAIPVEDALALEEGLLALRTRGACDPEPSPERDGERRRPALIDWSGLGRLERRAFASTVEAASLPKGQPAWERWECDVSENGLMYEVIEAYRLFGSDDVALCWHHGDGGNAAASHSHGPARISREALGALRAGLDSLWREALDRRRRGEPQWPEGVAWCAADAGMRKSRSGPR